MIRFCLALVAALFILPEAFAAAPGAGEARKANRLINEASPYLRQHAYNPVDWYPWGAEAFKKAKQENKPIFLSVGYSTCHWCHVMERESYSDADIARVINTNFVAIKVDRERRPDVDETYMLATQLISRSGGWPNNVFMTPERKPFYGGTYFPPDAFKSLLVQVAGIWRDEQNTLEKDADNIANAINTIMTRRVEAAEITPKVLKAATQAIVKNLDEFHGGFMETLKFPQEAVQMFLLRQAEKYDDKDALNAVTLTLDNLLNGGIQDHAGGGFHRYAVDPQWRVPHFEKMLYNQALMTQVLVRAYRITGTARYAAAARRTLDYVLDDMTASHGGFFSARDADSGEEEGTFYVWRPEQLEKALSPEDAKFARDVFGVSLIGNFEGQTTVLHLAKTPAEWAAELKISEAAFTTRLDAIRRTLAKTRASREAPLRDEKIVTAWNGMMIAAFAEAAAVLSEDKYRDAALKAATFIWDNIREGDG
ncbi:MAG: thioredoxin domain-containing protein, partial [Hyphomicrobiales bacterium]|nr:thioredoxin domain-containing protein [Hyphomicrobiales bacterium]